MLERLSVKNFAIIEDIDIIFKNGLTVLTGETGAGKSLIIDCISLLLGERATLEMIRHGQDKAIISGIFTYKNIHLSSFLDNLNIPSDSNKLSITRVISNTRSYIKINDVQISLSDLKTISKYLADIHLQFDMTKLLNKENYLDIIDGFNPNLIDEYKNKYLANLANLKVQNDKYNSLLDKINEIRKNREFYEFDLKELKALNLSINEDEDIKEQINVLKNYDKIYSLLSFIKSIIDKDSLSDIYEIKNQLKELSNYKSECLDLLNRLDVSYYEIEDIYDSIKRIFKNLDYDPNLLEQLENRLNEINLISKKHHKSVNELIDYQKELESIISSMNDNSNLLEEEKENLINVYNLTYQSGLDLSKVRRNVSNNVEKEILTHLEDLSLKSRFEIKINNYKPNGELDLNVFTNNGIDDIDFYIETNIGEGLKPLNKVISGGEASRIMLAFKTLYIKANKVETVIFDEIDTGISGEVASKVANKIYQISLSSQVITITHLPQVAALSQNHIKISKLTSKGRTYTEIKDLSLDEKIYEIALMISDGKVTPSQLEYAKEMVLNKR